jgi:hypothetical protein
MPGLDTWLMSNGSDNSRVTLQDLQGKPNFSITAGRLIGIFLAIKATDRQQKPLTQALRKINSFLLFSNFFTKNKLFI